MMSEVAEDGNDELVSAKPPLVIYDSADLITLQLLVRFLFMILS